MCKLQAAEVHMHYKHATSQDFFRSIYGVVLTGFLMQRLNLTVPRVAMK